MHILHPHIYPNANRPIVSLLSGANGVDNLDPNLTINGTTVTPMFRYKGGDADGTDWDEWTYGATLPLQAGTVPTYNQGSPLLGSNDDSVKFNAGGYYKDSGATVGDVATEDLVIELVFKTNSGGTEYLLSKRGTSGAAEGWTVYLTSNLLVLFFDAGVVQVSVFTGALPSNTWNKALIFVNRDEASSNGSKIYINSVLEASGDLSTGSATLSNTQSLRMGSNENGLNQYSSNIAYAAAWKYADWMQAGAAGPTEHQAIAKERFLPLTGFNSPKGTVTYTRPTEAVLSKREGSETKLYTVGEGWSRMVHHVDSASDEIKGYLAETEDENEILYSEDFADATWVKTRATIDSNNQEAPDGSMTADGLVGTALPNTHYVGQALASSAGEHVFAVYAKPGDKDWIYINIPTVANANAYYNIDTGAVGTVGAGATAYIDDMVYNNGYRRCIIIYTGGAPSHSHDIYAADADGDHTFTGDGTTVNTWLWGATHSDEGLGYPTSYIKTEASLVTRVKDDNLNGITSALGPRGTIKCKVLLPNHDSTVQKHLLYLSDGGSANESIEMLVDPIGDVLGGKITEGGVSRYDDGCTTDIADGVIHQCELKYNTGTASQKVDGVVEDTGTPAAIPDDLDQLEIGQTNTSTEQLNGVISNVEIYKK